jgi:hypothetical protein
VRDGSNDHGSPYTAQVILRPADAEARRQPTTSANLADALPDPAVADKVRDFFERAGFEVGDLFAQSLTIAGPLESFAATFGTAASDVEPILRGGEADAELDLTTLPDDVRAAIEAVVVTAKPDFGPWNP